ncbi:MAG: hypothetical protein GY717_12655 [Rhodobacteraceae bacterium]|nr:hypothetical protein [Paracoccaceae bacterium]
MSLPATALFDCAAGFAETGAGWERRRPIAKGRERQRKVKLLPGGVLFVMALLRLAAFTDFSVIAQSWS